MKMNDEKLFEKLCVNSRVNTVFRVCAINFQFLTDWLYSFNANKSIMAEIQSFFFLFIIKYNSCNVFVILLTRHNDFTIFITWQINEFDEFSNEMLKRYAVKIQKMNQTFMNVVQKIVEMLAEIKMTMEKLSKLNVENSFNINIKYDSDKADSEENKNGNKNKNCRVENSQKNT